MCLSSMLLQLAEYPHPGSGHVLTLAIVCPAVTASQSRRDKCCSAPPSTAPLAHSHCPRPFTLLRAPQGCTGSTKHWRTTTAAHNHCHRPPQHPRRTLQSTARLAAWARKVEMGRAPNSAHNRDVTVSFIMITKLVQEKYRLRRVFVMMSKGFS